MSSDSETPQSILEMERRQRERLFGNGPRVEPCREVHGATVRVGTGDLVSPMHLTLRLARLEEIEVEQAKAIRDEWTEVGRQMRVRREAAGVSLRALAAHLEISAPYLGDMERGFRRYQLCYVTKALTMIGANAEMRNAHQNGESRL